MARVRVVRGRGFDAFRSLRVAGLVLAVGFALLLVRSTWYKVGPEEVGVVTRFGAFDRLSPPGLHFKWPWGIEQVAFVRTRHVYKAEFGFRTAEAGPRTRYEPREFIDEKLMLTGDLNAAEVEWIVQYLIADPVQYLFKVRHPDETLRDLSESVMRQVVGDHSILEVLTEGREEINLAVFENLQEQVNLYEMGIRIQLVQLQNVDPPSSVKDSFNDVNQAEQEKERTINEAQQEYNRTIPRSRGEAQRVIQEAEAYKVDRVNRARGEAARFLALREEYQRAPEVTRQRLYLETMAEVLRGTGAKIVVDEDLTSALPLLHLGPSASTGPTPRGDR